MKIKCVPCNNEMDPVVIEDFGETQWCRKCGLSIDINWDKDTIHVDRSKNV